jgi:aryl-alcohol dehydrogenase-like predicted oxidoreductase
VERALELGINYFDTAASYGEGQSERHLGETLKDVRAEPYVGTKFRVARETLRDLRTAVVASVEASLQRLGRERVDLLQLHNTLLTGRASAGSPSPRCSTTSCRCCSACSSRARPATSASRRSATR